MLCRGREGEIIKDGSQTSGLGGGAMTETDIREGY